LQRIAHLDAFVQLIVEHVRQAKSIPLIGFEQAFLSLLHMKHIGRNIQLLQVLEQGPVIVAGHLQDHVDLGERHIQADAVNEGAKAFPRVLKGQGGTTLKALMAAEQRRGHEAPDMDSLPIRKNSHTASFA
jgi:hypothetical protein